MRVSISAIGSVIISAVFLYQIRFNSTLEPLLFLTGVPVFGGTILAGDQPLPAGLANTRDQTLVGQFPEANPADAELAVNRPRPAAHRAAAFPSDRVLGSALCFRDF
jgi:hypothetical protein